MINIKRHLQTSTAKCPRRPRTSPTTIWLLLTSLAYCTWLLLQHGQFPGANYDSYQYAYAVISAQRLASAELAEFARLHVHSGYFPLWQLLSLTGRSVWETASWLSIGCTAATVAGIYALASALGCRHRHALAATLLWQSFATVAFYANIPEVYAPCMLCLVLTMLYLERQRGYLAAGWFGMSIWLFLPSILLLPAFSRLKDRRLRWAIAGTALGLGLHLLTLSAYGIPFLSRLSSEKVYWQVASGPLWYLVSTWKTLAQSGMGLALILCLVPAILIRRRLTASTRQLMLLTIPLFLAPALWVKDHGSFFLPFGLVLSLLCPLLWQQWAGRQRWRSNAALAVILLFIAINLSNSWRQLAYDRSMGQAQVEFCQQALGKLPENSQVISTALLSTWLFVKEDSGRSDIQCRYFPWLVNAGYSDVLDRSLQELQSLPGTYFIDPTVPTVVVQAGQLLQALPFPVPGWPSGQVLWELKAIYLGGTKP